MQFRNLQTGGNNTTVTSENTILLVLEILYNRVCSQTQHKFQSETPVQDLDKRSGLGILIKKWYSGQYTSNFKHCKPQHYKKKLFILILYLALISFLVIFGHFLYPLLYIATYFTSSDVPITTPVT